MGLAIMVAAFLPASNLFFYVGFVIAERVLYIPRYAAPGRSASMAPLPRAETHRGLAAWVTASWWPQACVLPCGIGQGAGPLCMLLSQCCLPCCHR